MRAIAALLAGLMLCCAGCAGALPRATAPVVPAASAGSSSAPVAYGTYEWSVEDLVLRWKAGTLWSFLTAKHVNAVLAGFDDAFIAKCSTPQGAARMNALIAQASSRGVRVELLLGNPSWILPSGIASLKQILYALRAVHFAAVDLDLEPNEVKSVPIRTAMKDLAAAMAVYVVASPWPVSIDVNHVFVDSHGYCLMCGLQRAGVRRVNLMTYISDPAKVEADVRPVLKRFPAIAFTVSQSVEPPSVLPVWDSYWSDGFAKFYRDMIGLDAALKPQPNYAGITIESMQYLELMKP